MTVNSNMGSSLVGVLQQNQVTKLMLVSWDDDLSSASEDLQEALRSCTSLRTTYIYDAFRNDIKAVLENPHNTSISIFHPTLSIELADAIASSLRQNRTLVKLSFHCEASEEIVNKIFKSIYFVTSLKRLSISFSPIRGLDLAKLIRDSSLNFISITLSPDKSNEWIAPLKSALQKNHTLVQLLLFSSAPYLPPFSPRNL